jgi:hypothetical protein
MWRLPPEDQNANRIRRIFAVIASVGGVVLAAMGITLSGGARILVLGMALFVFLGGLVSFFAADKKVKER